MYMQRLAKRPSLDVLRGKCLRCRLHSLPHAKVVLTQLAFENDKAGRRDLHLLDRRTQAAALRRLRLLQRRIVMWSWRPSGAIANRCIKVAMSVEVEAENLYADE